MTMKKTAAVSVELSADGTAVHIIDQTLLPGQLCYLDLREREEMYRAIRMLQVRGAPAIGIFAAYAVYVLSLSWPEDGAGFLAAAQRDCDYLITSRPTAVNLAVQINRQRGVILAMRDAAVAEIRAALRREADEICRENDAMNLAISRAGLSLLHDGDTVLTHCNAGPLATGGYGTGLGPLILAAEEGKDIRAYVDETRPLLQGARLTAWELQNAGIPVTLICDNMASAAMKQGRIQAVMVGCDRMAANGDFANKIGTSGAAVLAQHYGVPFYVLLPSSTVDMACASGEDIPIELRDGQEIASLWYEKPMAPDGIEFWNPAFDVTDHSLVTAIITEHGVLYPPFDAGLQALFGTEKKEQEKTV